MPDAADLAYYYIRRSTMVLQYKDVLHGYNETGIKIMKGELICQTKQKHRSVTGRT